MNGWRYHQWCDCMGNIPNANIWCCCCYKGRDYITIHEHNTGVVNESDKSVGKWESDKFEQININCIKNNILKKKINSDEHCEWDVNVNNKAMKLDLQNLQKLNSPIECELDSNNPFTITSDWFLVCKKCGILESKMLLY